MDLGHTIERIVLCRLVHHTTGLRRHWESYLARDPGGRPTLKAGILEKVLIYLYLSRTAMDCLDYCASRRQGLINEG